MEKKLSDSRTERRKKWWNEVKSGRVLRARSDTGMTESVQKPSEAAAVSSRGFKSKMVAKPKTVNKKVQKQPPPAANSRNNSKSVKMLKEKNIEKKVKDSSVTVKPESDSKSVKQSPQKTEQNPSPENGEGQESVHMLKKYVLFVGNLPFSVTKQQVEEHFRKTGGVKAVRLPKERGTNRGKGFAYVEFNSNISHRIALRLHQTTLAGRKINVEFTSPGGKNTKRMEQLKQKNEKLINFKMPFDA